MSGDLTGPVVTFLSRSLFEAPLGGRSVLPTSAVVWTRLASLDRAPAEGGAPQEECPGQQHPGCSFKALLVVLRNPSNLCYMHSVVLSYLCSCTGDVHTFLGNRWEAFRTLFLVKKTLCVARVLILAAHDEGWTDVQNQHDVAEFAHFFMQRLPNALMQGTRRPAAPLV